MKFTFYYNVFDGALKFIMNQKNINKKLSSKHSSSLSLHLKPILDICFWTLFSVKFFEGVILTLYRPHEYL
jgi:hypothetical protein